LFIHTHMRPIWIMAAYILPVLLYAVRARRLRAVWVLSEVGESVPLSWVLPSNQRLCLHSIVYANSRTPVVDERDQGPGLDDS